MTNINSFNMNGMMPASAAIESERLPETDLQTSPEEPKYRRRDRPRIVIQLQHGNLLQEELGF